MSETHFEIPKRLIVAIFLMMMACIASLGVYIYQQDKGVVLEAIRTNGNGIRASTQVQQHLLQEVVRLDGADATHAANQLAHHESAKPDGG